MQTLRDVTGEAIGYVHERKVYVVRVKNSFLDARNFDERAKRDDRDDGGDVKDEY